MITYTIVLIAFAVLEGLIGFWLGNVHIIRDFLTSLLMAGALIFSYESLVNARKKKNAERTYGNRRLNVISAFVNMVYIQCTVLFAFLETAHHMIEHWDIAQHAQGDAAHSHNLVSGNHDDVQH